METRTIDNAHPVPARPRAWFGDTASPADRAGLLDFGPLPARTSLVKPRPEPRDDAQVLALLEGLAPRVPSSPAPYRVGVLDDQGEVYREVWLHGMYEALVFTARMNALGFRQEACAPGPDGEYDGAFSKP
ncbi:hypothetical protein [Ramlibacter algicola]|uniref:Uncharacterized protein n=1 Tax=Ramlibacter algicola TaxID=2795217 RepID=A0A934Q023_9BURK|nr:hypothetical protein [Ramlibacter algicola]MBK0392177.1 hypothetical protein [Ramlibacter algicola]